MRELTVCTTDSYVKGVSGLFEQCLNGTLQQPIWTGSLCEALHNLEDVAAADHMNLRLAGWRLRGIHVLNFLFSSW